MALDPFRNYDAWLEAPYQRRAEQGAAEEAVWESKGLDSGDIEPPHKPGDACPRCAEPKALATDEDGDLYCEGCGDGPIAADEQPRFDPADVLQDWADEAAERKAEAAAEARWDDDPGRDVW